MTFKFKQLLDWISIPYLHIRCRVDTIVFTFRYIALSASTIVIGVLGVLPQFGLKFFNMVPKVLLLIGLLLLIQNLFEILRLERGVILSRRMELLHFSTDYISKTYSGFQMYNYWPSDFDGSITDGGMGTVIANNALDAQLLSRRFDVRWIDRKFKVDTSLRGYVPAILRQINENRKIFNGRIVRMDTDLHLQDEAKFQEITLSATRYYDFICSNELFRYKVSSRKNVGELKTLGELGLIDYEGKFFDLSGSRLANPIGISVLALTKDGYFVLTRQTKNNSVNAKLLLSSGSGSLDQRDIEIFRSKDAVTSRPDLRIDFADLISTGMLREMEEETGIPKRFCTNTQVVGYSRWLDRGAKPEFYGLTILDLDREGVMLRKISRFERTYTIGAEMIKASEFNWREISNLQFGSLGKDFSRQIALPLAFNLRAIASHILEERAEFHFSNLLI